MPIPQSRDLPVQQHPSFVYWFWKPDIHARREYLRQAQFLLNMTPFSHPAYTQRTPGGGGSVEARWAPERPVVRRHLKEVAQRCRAVGAKLILQMWEFPVQTRTTHGFVEEFRTLTTRGDFSIRMPPGEWRILKVFSFEQVGRFALKGRTLLDVTERSRIESHGGRPFLVGKDPTGRSRRSVCALVISQARRNYDYDIQAPDFEPGMAKYLSQFANLGLSGFAMDEFDKTSPGAPRDISQFKGYYSPHADRLFKRWTGVGLPEGILRMRYRDVDNPRLRPRIAHAYLRLLRQTHLAVEQAVQKTAHKLLGPAPFMGFHHTYAEDWIPDGYDGYRAVSEGFDLEMWRHGFNYWEAPRDYAQTDSINAYPLRWGLSRCTSQPVWLNMFFAAGKTNLLELANAARWGGRVHWHAFNDEHGWGLDLRTDHRVRETIASAERKVQLLNPVQQSQPKPGFLVLMGYNGSLNWLEESLNEVYYTETFQFSYRLFQSGYICDLAPTYEISHGKLRGASDGSLRYGRAQYRAVVWTAPQYAEQSTLRLLTRFVEKGGRLWIVGEASQDESGKDISAAFRKLCRGAVKHYPRFPEIAEFSKSLEANGCPPPQQASCEYLDGSVVWADGNSFWENKPRDAAFQTAAGRVTASTLGLLSAKFAEDKSLEWIVSGGTRRVLLNGAPLVELAELCSFVARREGRRWRLRVQSETDRLSLAGRIAGQEIPAASLRMRLAKRGGHFEIEADAKSQEAITGPSSFLLQPLADWKISPRWEQTIASAPALKAAWRLTPGPALLHTAADLQILWCFQVRDWHVEMYVRRRLG